MADILLFTEIQRVHIDTESHHRTGATGIQGGDDTSETTFKNRNPLC
ncbi:Uncharacterised protein [Shigella sonnei]|nr:Uncharacterised protein [Shigella sonnei]CSE89711.1 Uncharacterised protein [Shigella sonnei]CSF19498.1 Uncharacterised protein [Shigella sonnei]CSF56053.1 Uncharacterised protein [Shigella sonnei]CSF89170.1 Uncharacterised protein [Shigella sonnei]